MGCGEEMHHWGFPLVPLDMCNGWWGDINGGEDITDAGEGRVIVRGELNRIEAWNAAE